MQFLDFPTLVIIVVAAVVIFRLRSVLGQRTGFDDSEEYHKRDTGSQPTQPSNDNVVKLPTKNQKEAANKSDKTLEAINNYAKPRTKLNKGLKNIYEVDQSFSPASFLSGADMAYEMIVMSFADGDNKVLKPLLSDEVFQGFNSVIQDRKTRNETVKSDFIGIDGSDIIDAKLDGSEAKVTVRFESQIVTATYNADGEVIEGNEGEVVRVKDIWTFSRDTKSNNPNWKLIATEAEG